MNFNNLKDVLGGKKTSDILSQAAKNMMSGGGGGDKASAKSAAGSAGAASASASASVSGIADLLFKTTGFDAAGHATSLAERYAGNLIGGGTVLGSYLLWLVECIIANPMVLVWLALGAAVVVVLLLLLTFKILMVAKNLYFFVQRARAAAARRASQKKGVVYLFGFPKQRDGEQPSCPVERVLRYLKLRKIPFEFTPTLDATISDTERLPCIEYDGVQYQDSVAIVDWLADKFGRTEDKPSALTPAQKAKRIALLALCDNIALHHKRATWVDNMPWIIKKYQQIEGVGDKYPALIVRFFLSRTRARVISMLNAHGHGDMPDALYHARFKADVEALAHFLGQQAFAVSDGVIASATATDALVAPWVRHLLDAAEELAHCVPALAAAKESAVLNAYWQRCKAEF